MKPSLKKLRKTTASESGSTTSITAALRPLSMTTPTAGPLQLTSQTTTTTATGTQSTPAAKRTESEEDSLAQKKATTASTPVQLTAVRIEQQERSASALGIHNALPVAQSASSPTSFGSEKMRASVAAVFPTTPSPATMTSLQDLRLQLALTPEPMDTALLDELCEVHGGDDGQPRRDEDSTDSDGRDILQSLADEDQPAEKEKEGVEEEGEGEGPPSKPKKIKSTPKSKKRTEKAVVNPPDVRSESSLGDSTSSVFSQDPSPVTPKPTASKRMTTAATREKKEISIKQI